MNPENYNNRAGGPWRSAVLYLSLAAVIAVGALVFFYVVDPAQARWLPKCIFHELTGLYCPGCGSTRALHSLAHGDIIAAISFNASLILVVIPFVLYMFAMSVRGMVTGRGADPRVNSAAAVVFVVLITIFTILRNISLEPFSFLAP